MFSMRPQRPIDLRDRILWFIWRSDGHAPAMPDIATHEIDQYRLGPAAPNELGEVAFQFLFVGRKVEGDLGPTGRFSRRFNNIAGFQNKSPKLS